MKRQALTGAVAAVVAASVLFGSTSVAYAAESVDNATTTGQVQPEGTDITGIGEGLGLVCIPGKEDYSIAYRGHLDMLPVVAKWNELKEKGREAAKAINPFWYAYDSTFNALRVSGDFSITFTVDSRVTVNEAVLADTAAWKAAYEAANGNNAFSQHMILDESKTPTYDAASGTITAFFKLRDGLLAGDLDADYKTLTELNIDTVPGLLSVSKTNLHDLYGTVDPNDFDSTAPQYFDMTNAQVSGTFYAPEYTGSDWRLGFMIPFAMSGLFPVTFGQPAPEPARLLVEVTKERNITYVEAKDQDLPKEVWATLSKAKIAGVAAENKDLPAVPVPSKVTVGKDTYTFTGWKTSAAYNDNPDVSADCITESVVGTWKKTTEKASPAKKTTEKASPAKKTTEKASPAKKLAKTGVEMTGSLALAAGLMAIGVGAISVVRRKYQR